MRHLVVLSATVAAFGLAACGGSTVSGHPSGGCVVTDTQTRVCGPSAIQWCSATEGSRNLKIQLSSKVGDDTKQLQARARRCAELTN